VSFNPNQRFPVEYSDTLPGHQPTEKNNIRGFAAENGAGAEGEMGECSEGITASKGSDGFDSRERSYNVGICPQEDRRRSKGTLGEDTSGAEEDCLVPV